MFIKQIKATRLNNNTPYDKFTKLELELSILISNHDKMKGKEKEILKCGEYNLRLQLIMWLRCCGCRRGSTNRVSIGISIWLQSLRRLRPCVAFFSSVASDPHARGAGVAKQGRGYDEQQINFAAARLF